MTSLALVALLQSVISVEAGLVNHVEGVVNVRVNENVAAGVPIRAGENGFVEILLNPGSFLRLGENSEAVLEGTELADIQVRLVSGAMVLEAADVPEAYPITVTTGDLRTAIFHDGVYKFEGGRATVLKGKLGLPNSDLAWKSGWSVYFDRVHRAAEVAPQAVATNLERWSAARAGVVARANAQAYRSLTATRTTYADTFERSWLWLPNVGAWTFFPVGRYQSPYGYRYYSRDDLIWYLRSQRTASSGSSGGGGASTRGTAAQPPQDSSSGGGGSGAPSAPAPTFRDIVPARNGPATQQPN
jgi:hypothetical protein